MIYRSGWLRVVPVMSNPVSLWDHLESCWSHDEAVGFEMVVRYLKIGPDGSRWDPVNLSKQWSHYGRPFCRDPVTEIAVFAAEVPRRRII